MSARLQFGRIDQFKPQTPFLRLEAAEKGRGEVALEVPLFEFAVTNYQIGARCVWIPPSRFFARHIHPNAYHFIYVLQGMGIMEYDGERYNLQPGEFCLCSKGVIHQLGAGEEGLLAMIITSPAYENGDPEHVTYIEAETLVSVEVSNEPSTG